MWCRMCGQEFEVKRQFGPPPKFCSGKCRAKASRQRRVAAVMAKLNDAETAIREAKGLMVLRAP
jgi:hypothetical protein